MLLLASFSRLYHNLFPKKGRRNKMKIAILLVPGLQAIEINDVLGHSFALLVPECSCEVADQENIQSLKIAVNYILTMMSVSVKSITNKFPADTVTGCILLGEVFFLRSPVPWFSSSSH